MDTQLDSTVELTAQAQDLLRQETDRIRTVRATYGVEAVTDLATSFALSFANLVGMGGRITRDGDSFLAYTRSGMVVGMVFFPEDRRKTLNRGRGTGDSLDPLYTDAELAEMFPTVAGEWSCHS